MFLIFNCFLAWHIYKTAKENGKNGFLWALVAFVVGYATQIVAGLLFGAFLVIGIKYWGWSQSLLGAIPILSYLLMIVVGFATVGVIYRYLKRIPDDAPYSAPPPPNFG